MTNVAGPISAMPGSPTEVFYRGTDSKMYVFEFSGGWNNSVLKSSISNVSSGGQIEARPGKVYYRGTDGNIWKFYKPGGVWDAAPLGNGDNATGQLVVLDGGEIIFRSSDGRLYEYDWNSSSGWVRTQVSTYNSVSTANLETTGDDVWFRNNSGGMMRATRSGSSWIVSFMGGSNNVGGDLAASSDNPTHVYYRGNDGRAWQFYLTSSSGWSQVPLDYETTNVRGPMVSLPAKVFYRNSNNDIWSVYWTTCGGKNSRTIEGDPVTPNTLQLEVYPNPARDMAYIQVSTGEIATGDCPLFLIPRVRKGTQAKQYHGGKGAIRKMVFKWAEQVHHGGKRSDGGGKIMRREVQLAGF